MNKKYLGDALDWWKGGLLSNLSKAGHLKRLKVDPMLTDPNKWKKVDYAFYAGLLRVDVRSILRDANHEYLNDLFLDPDTGMLVGKVRKKSEYVDPLRLVALLKYNPKRVLAVYQHAWREPLLNQMERIKKVIQEKSEKKIGFCYSSSHSVRMLFLSYDLQRIKKIYAHLEGFYLNKAKDRVGA